MSDTLKYLNEEFKLKSIQKKIINRILEKNNVVAILPVGYGKRLCYQYLSRRLKNIIMELIYH